jgi:surfeit locus 1 family protein
VTATHHARPSPLATATRRLLPASLATGVALAILIALGVWQLQRREWKGAILAAIDAAERGPPIPLPRAPAPFAKVSVSGTLLPIRALYGVDVRERLDGPPREGAQLLALLTRPGEPDIVVDLGWVPTGDGAPDPLAPRATATPATVVGYVRPAEHPSWLSAADDPAARRFYTLDPRAIGAALGVRNVAPFTLVALGAPASPDAPVPAENLPRPPNNHLQYAFTWFGLAGALMAVFVAWVRGR